MFRRKPDPQPVYGRDLWAQDHLVWPVQRTLMAAFKDLEDWPRRPLLEVPRDFKEPSTSGVVFWFPPWWHPTAEVRKTIVSIVSSRLGIADPVASWHAAGIQPKVIIRPRQRTPERVLWSQVRDAVAAASSTAPVLGLGVGGAVVDCDLIDDSPHIAVSTFNPLDQPHTGTPTTDDSGAKVIFVAIVTAVDNPCARRHWIIVQLVIVAGTLGLFAHLGSAVPASDHSLSIVSLAHHHDHGAPVSHQHGPQQPEHCHSHDGVAPVRAMGSNRSDIRAADMLPVLLGVVVRSDVAVPHGAAPRLSEFRGAGHGQWSLIGLSVSRT